MELRDYYKIIRRRIWIILLVFSCVVAGYSVFYFKQKPVFSASARIILRAPPNWRQLPVLDMPSWNTRTALIKSKPVINNVSKQLAKENFSVSPSRIAGGISVSTQKKRDFVDINYRDMDAETVKRVLSVLPGEFLEFDRRNNRENLVDAEETLETQLKTIKKSLQKYEDKLANYKRKNKITAPKKQFNEGLSSSFRINEQLISLKFKRQSINRKLKKFHDQLKQYVGIKPTKNLSQTKSQLNDITATLSQTRLRLQQLKQEYKNDNPRIKKTKKRVTTLENELDSTIDSYISEIPVGDRDSLRQQIFDLSLEKSLIDIEKKKLKKQLQNIKGKLGDISEKQSRLLELKRRVNFYNTQLNKTRSNLNRIRFNQSLISRGGKIISTPSSVNKSYPTSSSTFGFVVIVGLLLGISTGTILEYINDKVETKFDIQRYLNLPVLGVIPELDQESVKLGHESIQSPLEEQYHSIGGLLEYSLLKKEDIKSIQITSSIAQEGKSVNTSNLGISLAREGEKVLLLDFDLRNPNLHNLFNLRNNRGISNFITGQLEAKNILEESHESGGPHGKLSTIVEKTSVSGLDVVPSGPLTDNPVHYLKDEKTDELLSEFRKEYDILLIDSPPLASVIDPVILSTKSDGSLMMVGAGMVRKGEAQHAKRMLEDVDANILGTILNRAQVQPRGYYYYYYSSGYGKPQGEKK